MTESILTDKRNRAIPADVPIADPNATVALAGEQGCEAARPSNEQPCNAGDEAIRELAHRKWEAAGRPAGDGFDFFLEAEWEVNAERSKSRSAQGQG